MIRVLIADDQEMARDGLAMMLSRADDIEVVATAADGREAVEAAHRVRPDVCLLDVRMPRLGGVEACAELRREFGSGGAQVVIVTTFDEDRVVDDALSAGAVGFLLKSASAALVIEAVRAAASGDGLVAPEITGRLLRRLAAAPDPAAPTQEPFDALTEREEDVVALVAAGHTNAEIAELLHLSVATVKTHVNAILTKLGARNRVELAAFAFRSGRVT